MSKTLDKIRVKVRTGHANLSFFCGLLGGVLAALSPIGQPFIGLSRIGPWFMPIGWWVVLFVICLGDWAKDAIPNRWAVSTALLWPSCAYATLTDDTGKRLFKAANIFGKGTGDSWQKSVHGFLTPSSDVRDACTVFAVILVGAAVVYAQRYAKKASTAAGPGIGAGIGANSPLVRPGSRV